MIKIENTVPGSNESPVVLIHSDNCAMARDVVLSEHSGLHILTCDSYEKLPLMLLQHQPEVVYTLRFDGTPNFPRDALLDSDSVRWIAVGGSGTDHLQTWDPKKTVVSNAAGVAADMMAQYVVGMIYHFSLNMPAFVQDKMNQKWTSGHVEPVDDKTVLIIGLGATGRAVARLCKAQNMKTLGLRANPVDTDYVDRVSGIDALPEALSQADVVVVCVPLLDNTKNLLGSDQFNVIKKGSILIDVSRGGVVNESALLQALDDGTLQGAGLDVFSVEPLPVGHPLWTYNNVVITPHCSSVYTGWERKSAELFSDNLKNYRKGKSLFNVVDPARGY